MWSSCYENIAAWTIIIKSYFENWENVSFMHLFNFIFNYQHSFIYLVNKKHLLCPEISAKCKYARRQMKSWSTAKLFELMNSFHQTWTHFFKQPHDIVTNVEGEEWDIGVRNYTIVNLKISIINLEPKDT